MEWQNWVPHTFMLTRCYCSIRAGVFVAVLGSVSEAMGGLILPLKLSRCTGKCMHFELPAAEH